MVQCRIILSRHKKGPLSLDSSCGGPFLFLLAVYRLTSARATKADKTDFRRGGGGHSADLRL